MTLANVTSSTASYFNRNTGIDKNDDSTFDEYLEIFQASPRTAPSLRSRCTVVAKCIFFPVTLLFFAVQSLTIHLGVTGSESKKRDQNQLNKLKAFGGEDVRIKTEDGVVLEGTYLANTAPKEGAKTILICSGSDQSHEHYTLPMVDSLLEMGHHVMVFNYRGFGSSEGRCTEKGIYLDTEAVYQYLVKQRKTDPSALAVLGYSLGGGAATDLATHHKIDLILDRTFASMSDVAYREALKKYGIFFISGMIVKILFYVGSHFGNLAKLKNVDGKIFIARGLQDEIMTSQQFEKIKNSIDSQKLTVVEPDVEHIHTTETLWFGRYSKTSQEKSVLEGFLEGKTA